MSYRFEAQCIAIFFLGGGVYIPLNTHLDTPLEKNRNNNSKVTQDHQYAYDFLSVVRCDICIIGPIVLTMLCIF